MTVRWHRKPAIHGDAVLRLFRLGRRYTAYIRLLTLIPTVVIAFLVSTDQTRPATTVVLLVLTAWSAVYVCGQLRGVGDWAAVVDAGVLTLLAFESPRVVPEALLVQGKIWTIPFLTFACVAYQYHLGRVLGAVLAIVVHGGLAAGVLPAGAPPFTVISVCWSLLVAVLARTLWTLVQRGGRLADRTRTEAQRARRSSEIARAVRAEDRALTDALHDTAATTLLMVGLGQTHGDVARQASRDLEILGTFGTRAEGDLDLVALLRTSAAVQPHQVQLVGPVQLVIPAAVGRAIADAASEAVHNSLRHAGTDMILVQIHSTDSPVRVSVVDAGVGFDPGAISPTRHGLRDSIQGRMQRIGGRAVIESVIGKGTTVRLEWPHA